MSVSGRPPSVRGQFIRPALALVALVVVGTAGYMAIERWSLRDAFYMTMITITTVGYREVRPLSLRGELFTVALVSGGVGTALYALNTIVRLAMEGELRGAFEQDRMRRRIEHMRNHTVLCGYGRVGEEIARALVGRKEPFVVLDRDPDALTRSEEMCHEHVEGDATDDDVLRRAGIERARCLITALDSDADNCWVVLSARALNPTLWIVSRADHPEAEAKLRHAGADRVISPPSIGGLHMALAAVQPAVLDFTQTLVHTRATDLMLAQLNVLDNSKLVGQSLDAALAGHESITVLGIQRADGSLLVKPDPRVQLQPGDELIVLGRPDDLETIGGAGAAVRGA
jgi:voltage-gated potassium channel